MKFWLGWHSNNLLNFFRGAIATSSFLSIYCFSSSVLAAERVTVRAGFLQQTVEVDALEDFVQTGKVSSDLKPYKFLLTSNLRQALSKSLHVDPILVEPFLADLFSSPDGEKLLAQLGAALPGSSSQAIEETLVKL
ncbi:MAG: alpha/beta hydrolase [Hydrococcus sp. RM1_1_31]|nr:alpha/beta hydrolase [Hydrococcus sp. RM1_1_31]